jgi:hypothetical protein
MNSRDILIAILGLGLLASGTYGVSAFLEMRKDVRLEEIRSDERRAMVEAMRFASSQQTDVFKEVLEAMKAQNEATNRAAEVAIRTHEHLLGAAAQTPETIIEGQHISRDEARELRASPRRPSHTRIVVQEMRVVDINTADLANTTVVIEDLDTLDQYRVTFRDSLIAEDKRDAVFEVLKNRGAAWFTLRVREVGGEARSVEISDVSLADPTAGGQGVLAEQ